MRFRRQKIALLIVMLSFFIPACIYATEHLSVPLTDPIYQVLESAQIRSLIDRLPTAKPYSNHIVEQSLKQLLTKRDRLSETEIQIVKNYLEAHSRDYKKQQDILQSGAIYTDSQNLNTEMGAWLSSNNGISFNAYEFHFGTEDFLNLYLRGDMGNNLEEELPLLSYGFDMGFGEVSIAGQEYSGAKLTTLNQIAFAPYTFTSEWEGYSYSLLDPFNNVIGDEGVYIAFTMDPEISTSLFDDHLQLSFSRIPRNWGLGEDSLLLSGQAPPFVSFALQAKIFPWMDYSFLVGELENYGDSSAASTLQNMVTIKTVDVRPTDWFYLGVHEAVVWPKRMELGYLNPLIFSSLYQGQIGDFDNIIGGISAGISIPKYADFYGTFMIDEFSPTSLADMFERVRNLFSFQAGVKALIPGTNFGTLTAQYTKIEPFTYTHPPTQVPWITSDDTTINNMVYESFVTNGYGISSKLDPNSDELLIKAETYLTPEITLLGSYQMIRHGDWGGGYNSPLTSYHENNLTPDGMVYPSWLGGNDEDIEDMRKSFLYDGLYKWYHMFSVGAEVDGNRMIDLPVKLSIKDTLVNYYKTDNDVDLIDGTQKLLNYVTISMQIWGE